ncbi:RHS repeat-associated core domain-containing protein [Streptomyces beijiangensis]|uniref:RHS repeat-associated core domain-containing protein n=1 Tax=Streptomyces beijiangensis TaxID=163361 RepID=UPI0027DB5854|nr:RHS repeat-associated core domain-containing protein [Streptomyces beijiangensis]
MGALVLALSVPAGLIPLAVAADPLGRPDVPKPRVSNVKAITTPGAKAARDRVAKGKAANRAQADRAHAEQHSTWPKASKITHDIGARPNTDALVGLEAVKPDKTKRTATPSADGKASVNVLGQDAAKKAGITGVLFTAAAEQSGTAQVSFDYSTFASAVGGSWSTRLGLLRFPACVLNTPEKPGCRKATPVASTNNLAQQTVNAPVTLAAQSGAAGATAVFALAATTATSTKGAGDFKATPLAASSTWEAGGSSGSFTWSYPLSVPPAAAGPMPSLGLSYDSGSIDGRTANTNNQGSMVGEGLGMTESYIERKYGSCDDDGQTDKFDLCWKYENASIVLKGKASELVKDDTKGIWHLKDDDASKVTVTTGADNGDDDGEVWTVVTGEGTTYTFGLNKLPGAGTQRTNSVWTAPVFGDDEGETGYKKGTTFADRSEDQAWRWNLDMVQDIHGNASTYWYHADTNYYAKNGDKDHLAEYTRGGYLEEIRYGQKADSLFTGTASGKVTFDYTERCTAADCSSLTKGTADNWPDVPFDAICAATATDCLATGPAFFTRKRLTSIDTFAWSTAAEPDAYKPVDSYKLTQEFLDGNDIGNSSDHVLTLKSLQHIARNGTEIKVPPVDFTYHMYANRVDAPDDEIPVDDILPLTRPRIYTITSEAGAITTVNLSDPQCVRGTKMPTAEDNNALSCYPVRWAPNGGDTTELDWFHKYNVTAVSTADPAGQNALVENSYTYENPAWHYNDDPMTPNKDRTWSIWRGYGKVTSKVGDTNHPQSKTVSVYLQGMNGDKKADGTSRSVSVPGISFTGATVASLTDSDQYAGTLREQITYNGSTPVSFTVNTPWSKSTATQHKSYADTEAYFVGTQRAWAFTYLTATSSWRQTLTETSYDDYGMASSVYNSGDYSKSGDESCTRTWYARNDDKGLTGLVSRTRVVGSACTDSSNKPITDEKLTLPTTTATRGDVLSDDAIVYDNTSATGWTATQTPTLGLPTWTGRAKAYPAANGTADRDPATSTGWQTLTKTTYDTTTAKLGRPLTITDADGNLTSTAYYPADKGPLTSTIITAPKLMLNGQQHKAYTYLDPARGSVTSTLDANLKKTENTYDALGRLTNTWLPNRQAANDSPNAKYNYSLERGKQPWTSVSTLKADGTTYQTTYAITDALLRPLQTQTPSALGGGRILTDTRYDTRGLAYESYADIYDDKSTPNGTYTRAEYGGAPKQTNLSFDAAGRPTTSDLLVFGVKKWSTTTSYTGDSVAATAPAGGTASRTITDAMGRTTETRTYGGTTPADTSYGSATGSAYTSVKQSYTRDGKPLLVTGPDDAKWSYTYDLFGRQVTATDPDKGTTSTTYTALDQTATTQDANKATLVYKYDELGRKTAGFKTDTTPANQLAAWTYDGLLKGLPDASIRYEGGTTGKAYTKKVSAYDSLGRATSTDLILPSDDPLVTSGAVTSTTTFSTSYRLDGTVNTTTEPAAGGLPSEIVQPKYNGAGLPVSLSGTTDYLQNVAYSTIGEPQQLTLATSSDTSAKKAFVNNTFEQGTGRLLDSNVTDETHPWKAQDLAYTYDPAGNVTSIEDPATLGGTSKPDYQCFTYDAQRRLTEAWTPKTADCADTGRTTANIDGPATYWTSYTYTASGQRATETQKTGTPATTTYCYDPARKHALTATTKAADCTDVTPQYTYYADGSTKTRSETAGSTTSQTLLWNPEGKLSKLTEGTTSTDYLYDADGSQLIRRNANGETVLYLGTTEVHLKAGKKWASRYYSAAGSTIAVRTNETGTAKLSFLASDAHGTSSLSLDSATQAITKRYTTPFGSSRGTPASSWPDDKAFLGKPADTSTGLTHVGAREYDPTIGQFISIDPLLELDKHQTLNGYSYGANNPNTFSDPTGRGLACGRNSTDGIPCPKTGSKGRGDGGDLGVGGDGTASTDSTGSAGGDCSSYGYHALEACTAAVAQASDTPDAIHPNLSAPGMREAFGIPDLGCEDGDHLCKIRQSELDFSIPTGTLGGAVGFFAVRPGARWNILIGLPEGISRVQFNAMKGVFAKKLDIEADVAVQGSRVTGNVTGGSDIDIAVRVSPEAFDAMVQKSWKNPNPGSSKARTRDHAVETGKITAGDARPKLSGIRDEIQGILGDTVSHVDVSIIRRGGPFDNGPFLEVK